LYVQWVEIEIHSKKKKECYHNCFITNLSITPETVEEIARVGRGRWMIENEAFNTLKNQGYHLEHNYGHGKQYLSNNLVILNLFSFALHTLADLLHASYQTINHRLKNRKTFFEEVRTLLKYCLYPSWEQLLQSILASFLPRGPTAKNA